MAPKLGRRLSHGVEREEHSREPRLHIEHTGTLRDVLFACEALEAKRARKHGIDMPHERQGSIIHATCGRRIHSMIRVLPIRIRTTRHRKPTLHGALVDDAGRAFDILSIDRVARLLDETREKRHLHHLETARHGIAQLGENEFAWGLGHGFRYTMLAMNRSRAPRVDTIT